MVYLKPKQLIIKDCARRFVFKLYRHEVSRGLFATAELLVSLFFLFVLCGGLSWLHVSFLLHAKYIISCRIVSYGPLSKVISATLSQNMCNLIFRSLTVGIL